MRPVNLIPPEERRGASATSRTGPLPYVILGALAVALVAISALVLTGKQIDDRTAEKAGLEAQAAEATARAQELAPFAEFAQVSEARNATVVSLAQSRFDWERVMRELSLVLPDDVWLTNLSASVAPGSGGSTAGGPLSTSITGPSLAITGCTTGHEAAAGFLEALKDIDGVTRVGIATSERGSQATGGADASAPSTGASADCRTKSFISQFEITVSFDEVAVPPADATAPEQPATGAEPELADARQQEQQGRDSAAQQTDKARNAANIVPGVAK